MNRKVEQQLAQVHQRIDQLRTVLDDTAQTLEDNAAERQTLREEQFRQRKQIVTLEHKGTEFDAMRAQNERLAARQSDLHQRLRAALTITRALAQEIRQP